MSKILGRVRPPSASMVVGLLALVVAASGAAFAAIPSADDEIHGCYEKRTGLLRVIDAEAGKTCTRWETPISWNQEGPPGQDGLDGQDGVDGEDGQDGGSFVGSPCTRPNGTAGTVEMNVGAFGVISLTCVNVGGGGGGDGGGDPTDCDDGNPYTIDTFDGSSGACSYDLVSDADLDADGYVATEVGGDDCEDSHPGIHPEANEIADGVDNDCDGDVDEDVSIESCNGIDDDLDGAIDENWPQLGQAGPNGGVIVCSADGTGTVEST